MEQRSSAHMFATRLASAMDGAGLKQADVVRMAQERGRKLGKSQVSQYVSGKTLPRRDVLALLADILGVDAAWLSGASSGPARAMSGAAEGKASMPDAQDVAPACAVATGGASALPNTQGSAIMQENITDANATEDAMPIREFKRSQKLNNVEYDVRGPVVDEARRMEASGQRVLKLNIGNPAPFGFRTPDEVVEDMAHQLVDCEGYSDSRGMFHARKAIMQYAQLKHLPNVGLEDIYTGNGVSELINVTMTCSTRATRFSSPRLTIRCGRPAPRLPAVRPCTTCATSRPTGTRTSPTWNARLRRAPRRLSSSTRTTPRVPCTPRRCLSR